jgi:4-oxalomesaconate hydratase
LCRFTPTVYVEIMEVFEQKAGAMPTMATQRYLRDHHRQRGHPARKITGNVAIRQAEAFQSLLSNVVEAL